MIGSSTPYGSRPCSMLSPRTAGSPPCMRRCPRSSGPGATSRSWRAGTRRGGRGTSTRGRP
eukprot:14360358-Alexandrium_andersonii.AAC.1